MIAYIARNRLFAGLAQLPFRVRRATNAQPRVFLALILVVTCGTPHRGDWSAETAARATWASSMNLFKVERNGSSASGSVVDAGEHKTKRSMIFRHILWVVMDNRS